MSKFYAVQLTTTAIVQVEDDQDELFAETIAMDHKREIVADNPLGVTTLCQVHSQADLRAHGWDGTCLPYGGNGDARLQELLPAQPSHVLGARSASPVAPQKGQ